MSCRSESDEYKSALTDRFTDLTDPTPFDFQNAGLFKHQSLQDPSTQLRYLYLLPKTYNIDHDGQTIVRCQLLSDTKEQAPRYIGLSYTWGDPELRRPILVGDKVFHATVNLVVALEHLQEEGKTISFWIDALCIDQTNLDEKSIQVQRMGNIFTSAAFVIAWLGPAADESELALQELRRHYDDSSDFFETPKHKLDETYAALPIESINAFFDRPWFKRVWVGQEVALNEQVIFVCGQIDIEREDLLSCDLESSDPRDYIYSSLGRISSLGDCVLDVDYTKRVQDVYTEFAVAVIRVGEVDWLSCNWRLSVNYADLPSWVPDWSNTEPCRSSHGVEVLKHNIVEVCETGRGGKALKISARRITQISRVNCSLQSQQETSAFDLSTSAIVTQQEEERVMSSLDTIRQALDGKERWGHEDAERAICDLSSGMSFIRGFSYDDEIWEGDLYESYRAFRGLEILPSDVADPRQWRRDGSRAYLKVLQEPNIENFFVTAADIVGTSRDKVQPGDWVCLLGGVHSVWILRQVDGGFYRIVSIANVFPWEDVETSDAPVETITII